MALSDELDKLQDLHQRGALTDAEFARAKARLLDESAAPGASPAPSPAVASDQCVSAGGAPSSRGRSPWRAIKPKTSAASAMKSTVTEAMVGV